MDIELEAAIDRVGRERVFAKAETLGYQRYDAPPKWVWWGIVKELEDRPTPPSDGA